MLFVGLAFAGGWRVIETESFRLHVPQEAEELGLHLGARLEGIRERVSVEVGYTPSFKTELVLRDPYGVSNALAVPLGRSPRVDLWATPPGADSTIGHYHDWTVDLVLHEDVHVVHMLTPPRGVSGQLMYSLFKLAPIPIKAPRWVLEGYATTLEGTLTGAGRPYADYRATFLRQLAVNGALPSYGELDWSGRWSGSSYAYLVGSAYLEWLEARSGEGSARKLWARLTARKQRNFEVAFRGVYGERPSVLYQRFTAELTRDAMQGDTPVEHLWMETRGTLERPALSPDGSRLAAVAWPPDGPAQLVVWKTEVNEKAVERRREKIEELLERDPEDAAPVDPKTPPHERDRTWIHRTHLPHGARWLDDDTLLFVGTVADREGAIRRDVFQWDLDGRPKRLTHGADVHAVDAQAGRIVGLTSRWGRTGIVEISPQGDLHPLVPAALLPVLDQPRLAPDGKAFAYLRNDGAGFRIWVHEAGADREIELPEGWQPREIAWGPDGIVASIGVAGRIDLYRVGQGAPIPLTTSGAAFAPEPVGDDLFYTELYPAGHRLHRMDRDRPLQPVDDVPLGLAGRPTEPTWPAVPTEEVTARRMGLGRLEPRVLLGGMVGASDANMEAGFRLGDIVGRNEIGIFGSLGTRGGVSGGGAWWANRTLPVHVTLRGWGLIEGTAPDPRVGGSLGLGVQTVGSSWGTVAELEGWLENGRGAMSFSAGLGWVEPKGRWVRGELGGRASIGREGAADAGLAEVYADLTLGGRFALKGHIQTGVATGAPYSLGGVVSNVRGDAAQWSALQIGWLPAFTDAGDRHDGARVSLLRDGVGVVYERWRLHDAAGTRPYSFVGVLVDQDVPRDPLLKLPNLAVEIGLGCRVEIDGPVERACRKVSDYSAWTQLRWTP